MRHVTGPEARATMAHLVLGDASPSALGDVHLHAHQAEGAGRLQRLLELHRGALLADEVGLGKTFTALALARARRTLVIAPAALRQVWREGAARAGVAIGFISMEELSRGRYPELSPELVIVDEAHHFRSRATRRFSMATRLCARAQVLLLTATPVQNREADLRVLLSLFLGERAHAMPRDALADHVVRRTASDAESTVALPAVDAPHWLECADDADCLDRILALPDPVPPRDGGVARELVIHSLALQWASSRAAFTGALRRRMAKGLALRDSLRAGRVPSRSELSAWTFAEGAQQLSFPELVVAPAQGDAPDCGALENTVQGHVAALEAIGQWLAVTPDPDVARARLLEQVLAAHPGRRVVAFSEYADTVAALFARLSPRVRAAMLTHAGGQVAGGRISRAEVIARFAPGASARALAAERIDLLLTTDVLSEGVGLHDASVIVHLDLAWNPGRLEQRVGRLRRIGATHSTVAVYAMRPPAHAERLLRMEERLRGKLLDAARTVGVAGAILPGMTSAAARSASRAEQRIHALLAPWGRRAFEEPVCAAVQAARPSAIACIQLGSAARLVVFDGERFTTDREAVADALGMACGADAPLSDEAVRDILRRADGWLRRSAVGAVVELTALRVARSRQTVLRRVEGISRRIPRHAQPRVASLVSVARAAATATLSAGAERVLEELARARMPDEAWLRAVHQFAALHAPARAEPARVLALLVLVRG